MRQVSGVTVAAWTVVTTTLLAAAGLANAGLPHRLLYRGTVYTLSYEGQGTFTEHDGENLPPDRFAVDDTSASFSWRYRPPHSRIVVSDNRRRAQGSLTSNLRNVGGISGTWSERGETRTTGLPPSQWNCRLRLTNKFGTTGTARLRRGRIEVAPPVIAPLASAESQCPRDGGPMFELGGPEFIQSVPLSQFLRRRATFTFTFDVSQATATPGQRQELCAFQTDACTFQLRYQSTLRVARGCHGRVDRFPSGQTTFTCDRRRRG